MTAKEKTNLLEVVPCRSEHITAKWEGETVVLSFPRFKRSWMQRFLVPKGMSKEFHVHLEAHGTAVWELIDGRRTVGEIIEELAGHFQNETGYEARVSAYLYQMRKDGFIKWMAPVANRDKA
ncbi:PqqD family protein [uncultured Bacteroides sp.]|uniref:PqqD family protein n=1 Tax=uncultured Bacteroides sp. TaxID=162156 RepID=UPI0025DE1F1F|nr:PqqD family protein [uncultured Bacteroides sp.]